MSLSVIIKGVYYHECTHIFLYSINQVAKHMLRTTHDKLRWYLTGLMLMNGWDHWLYYWSILVSYHVGCKLSCSN